MISKSKKIKIGIIGLGRVGLPFLLFLESKGFDLTGIDNNFEIVNSLKNKKMPFSEKGCDNLLKKSKAHFSEDIEIIKKNKCEFIFITVGTPLRDNIEVNLSHINKVLKSLLKILKKGQTIILRSTIGPETSSYVKNYIEQKTNFKVGKDLFLAFCPERIAENLALKEFTELPQIIGVEDNKSYKKTEKIFKKTNVKIFKTNFLSAELVKLFNNNYRYIEFAMANQFAILANNFGQNIYDIIEMCNYNYPRGKIFRPGLTGGTCLRKDFGMLNERVSSSDLFLTAWKVNEYMPYHLASTISDKYKINGKNIGILGYSFKKNSDDIRESLVPKLIRQIEKKLPKNIFLSEPCSKQKFLDVYENRSTEFVIKNSNIIFIAINHDKFKRDEILKKIKKNTVIVDIWNHLKKNKFIYKK